MGAWGNYGAPDLEYRFCAFTWRPDMPTDENFGPGELIATRAARETNGRGFPRAGETSPNGRTATGATGNAPSRDGSEPRAGEILAPVCLTCGETDGRTRAGALDCWRCLDALAEFTAQFPDRARPYAAPVRSTLNRAKTGARTPARYADVSRADADRAPDPLTRARARRRAARIALGVPAGAGA